MRIAFSEINRKESVFFRKNLKKHKLFFFNKPLNEKTLAKIKWVECLVVFVHSQISRGILDKLPNLKYILTMSMGYDHIDIDYCKQKNIIVSNVPTYSENSVAEHTFSLILALSRKLYQSIERTHHENSFETDDSLMGFDLNGKTLGVIGCGSIGKNVVKIAKGFGMKVLVVDKCRIPRMANGMGFEYSNLDRLLKNSDIISLHVPYTNKTHHLIDKNAINKMKKGVYLINTARGAVVDTVALVYGLKSGKIAGVGLDVLEEEKNIIEERELIKKEISNDTNLRVLLLGHQLMKMNNVIITPHNAFNSAESQKNLLKISIKTIKSFLKGKPINTV